MPGIKPQASSYVRRRSSEIRKLLPKSPRKAVTVVKHLWNQLYKSPRKRKLIDQMWMHDREMGKFMYFLGKYRNNKNEIKLNETVRSIKKRYSSLRSACSKTNIHWSQFHKCTRLNKRKIEQQKYIRKLHSDDIKAIGKFFQSEDTSFPLPDKICWQKIHEENFI